jgi:hypothetical protein
VNPFSKTKHDSLSPIESNSKTFKQALKSTPEGCHRTSMVNHSGVLAGQFSEALTVVVYGSQGFDNSICIMAIVH